MYGSSCPRVTVTIYFIDIRAMDRYEDFYTKVKADENVKFVKSKIARSIEAGENGNLILEGEDTASWREVQGRARPGGPGHRHAAQHRPQSTRCPLPVMWPTMITASCWRPNPGVIGAGCVKSASNVATCVQEGTAAAALKAIQAARR